MTNKIYVDKVIDMSLVDYFAIRAPEPSEQEVSLERSYDLNKARLNDKLIVRNDLQIKCQLRYKFAEEMMKAR